MADQFTRFGKGGKRINIQASYNPIMDTDGKVLKVVKFATDVTERLGVLEALRLRERAAQEGRRAGAGRRQPMATRKALPHSGRSRRVSR